MSMPGYPTYKDSGVEWLGDAPAHWAIVRAGALFREISEDGEDGLPILSVSIHNGVSDKQLGDEELDRKVSRSEDISKYKKVVPGDLVYNMMRAWQGGFGTVKNKGMVSPAYVVARPVRELSTQFIELLMRTPCAVEEMRRLSHGVTDFRLRLYWQEFKSMELLLPPTEEQSAITAFLDRETGKIDTLVAEQEKLIALLKEKRQAVISHAVTKGLDPAAPMRHSGIEWLDEVPAHWDIHRTRRHLSKKLSNGIFKKKDYFGSGALLVNVFDIYRPDFSIKYSTLDRVSCSEEEELSYRVDEGDLFFVRSSLKEEGIAAAAVAGQVSEATVFECHLIQARFIAQNFIGRFGSYLFNSIHYRAHMVRSAKVTTMTTIDQEAILSTPLLVPPIQEQCAIVAFLDQELSRFDTLSTEAQRAIDLLKERRNALISAAVTGKVDVRELADRKMA